MNNFFFNLIPNKSPAFFLIAGPCVIESYETSLAIAKHLKKVTQDLGIPYIFKASYDKANRTSIQSFRGPGPEQGLEILQRIKTELNIPVMMVATDLQRGEKVVLKSGSILPALRATMSVPGLFPPARTKGRWLVDGGVVDPVPVGVARATEADVVIAVDLNSGIASRRMRKPQVEEIETRANDDPKFKSELLVKLTDYYETAESNFKNKINELLGRDVGMPDIIDTVMSSINIMQERITRINLAVEPPDVLIQPRLGALKMMDFDQVELVIEEGYIGVKEKMEDIKALLEMPGGQGI